MSLRASPKTRALGLVAIGAATVAAISACRQVAGITGSPSVDHDRLRLAVRHQRVRLVRVGQLLR
jgi:hypothetical protein